MCFNEGMQHPNSEKIKLIRTGSLTATVPPTARLSDGSWLTLIKLPINASFISARITRIGGNTSLEHPTTIRLSMANPRGSTSFIKEVVVRISFEEAYNCGLTKNNPHGITYLKGKHKALKIDTLSIGFPEPLSFKGIERTEDGGLVLQVYNTSEDITQISAEVIYSGFLDRDPEPTDAGDPPPMFP